MTDRATYFTRIARFVGRINLAIAFPFSWKTKAHKKTESSENRYAHLTSSAFSKPDPIELLAQEDDIAPLVEAEVYAIYGRTADAHKVLDSGVKAGRITAEEVTLFWSKQHTDRTRKAAA
jgi:hypothetical protein